MDAVLPYQFVEFITVSYVDTSSKPVHVVFQEAHT